MNVDPAPQHPYYHPKTFATVTPQFSEDIAKLGASDTGQEHSDAFVFGPMSTYPDAVLSVPYATQSVDKPTGPLPSYEKPTGVLPNSEAPTVETRITNSAATPEALTLRTMGIGHTAASAAAVHGHTKPRNYVGRHRIIAAHRAKD